MEPIEIFAMDEDMNRLTGSIPYTSLIWNRRYYKPGQFELHVMSSLYSPDWAYIYTFDRPETGIIQKVEYSDTTAGPDGEDEVTLSGFFFEELLNKLVFLIEQTEIERYYIPKPMRQITKEPEFAEGEDGTLYLVQHSADGTSSYKDTSTGKIIRDPGAVTEVDVKPADTLIQQRWPTNNTDKYPDGYWYTGLYKTSFDYYAEDGELHQVDRHGDEKTYELVVKPTTLNNGTGSTYAVYRDDDGELKWVNGVVRSAENGYFRRVQKWEERTDGLEIVKLEDGNKAAVAYREVKGPWQLRTDVGQVGRPMDNVQQIILWAQVCFGNNMTYDEPGFTGETKTIDPSLNRVGDLFFSEMQTVGASVRVFYDFVLNQMVFSVWRGLDRTQGQGAEGSGGGGGENVPTLPEGYTQLKWIESTGTQWVDTGIKPDSSTRVECEFDCIDVFDTFIFGSRPSPSDSGNFCLLHAEDLRSFRDDWGSEKTAVPASSVPASGSVALDKNANETTFNGSYTVKHAAGTWSGGYNMYLFAVNNAGSAQKPTSIRLHSFRVWSGGGEVLDLIPARRESDGSVGLCDSVSGGFFANSGSGSFTAGPVARHDLPDGFTELEYIESAGAQYIDTGFTPGLNARVVADFEITAATDATHRVLFGSRESSTKRQFYFGWAGHSSPRAFRSDYGANNTAISGVAEVGRHYVDKNKGVTTLDGHTVSVTNTSFVTPGSMYIFCGNDNGTANAFLPCRLYSMQVYSNGELTRSFVPARRDSDGAAGLYDMVTGAMYLNSGSGSFTEGPEIAKPKPPEPESGSGNPWAVFSDTWGTLYHYKASRDTSNYRNKCYVLYDYFEPQWDEDGTPYVEKVVGVDGTATYTVPQTHRRGYEIVRLEDGVEDAEVWLDLREEDPEGADQLPDPSERFSEEPDLSGIKKEAWDSYIESIRAQGEQLLVNDYGIITNLDTGTLWQDGYMSEWDLGDKVDMAVERLGLVKESRITAVTETHESGSSTVQIEIGEELLTITRKQAMV